MKRKRADSNAEERRKRKRRKKSRNFWNEVRKYRIELPKNFKLGRLRGSGQYGTTFECTIGKEQRCIKIFRFKNSEYLRTSVNHFGEIYRLMELKSEHIMACLGWGIVKSNRFSNEQLKQIRIMEYKYIQVSKDELVFVLCELALGSLSSCKNRLNIYQKILVCGGIGEGIEYIHKNDMCHLDIKSSNCLVFRNGDKTRDFRYIGKVCDMGTVCPCDGSVIEYNKKGTIFYSSPEQYYENPMYFQERTRKIQDPKKIDVYGFGILLIELFSDGRYLPDIDLKSTTLAKDIHENGNNPDLSSIQKVDLRVPLSLNLIIKSCLTINPDDRPTISRILNDLKILFNEMVKKRNENSVVDENTAEKDKEEDEVNEMIDYKGGGENYLFDIEKRRKIALEKEVFEKALMQELFSNISSKSEEEKVEKEKNINSQNEVSKESVLLSQELFSKTISKSEEEKDQNPEVSKESVLLSQEFNLISMTQQIPKDVGKEGVGNEELSNTVGFDSELNVYVYKDINKKKNEFVMQFGLFYIALNITTYSRLESQFLTISQFLDDTPSERVKRDMLSFMKEKRKIYKKKYEKVFNNESKKEKMSFNSFIERIKSGSIGCSSFTLQVITEVYGLQIYLICADGKTVELKRFTPVERRFDSLHDIYIIRTSESELGYLYEPLGLNDEKKFRKFKRNFIISFRNFDEDEDEGEDEDEEDGERKTQESGENESMVDEVEELSSNPFELSIKEKDKLGIEEIRKLIKELMNKSGNQPETRNSIFGKLVKLKPSKIIILQHIDEVFNGKEFQKIRYRQFKLVKMTKDMSTSDDSEEEGVIVEREKSSRRKKSNRLGDLADLVENNNNNNNDDDDDDFEFKITLNDIVTDKCCNNRSCKKMSILGCFEVKNIEKKDHYIIAECEECGRNLVICPACGDKNGRKGMAEITKHVGKCHPQFVCLTHGKKFSNARTFLVHHMGHYDEDGNSYDGGGRGSLQGLSNGGGGGISASSSTIPLVPGVLESDAEKLFRYYFHRQSECSDQRLRIYGHDNTDSLSGIEIPKQYTFEIDEENPREWDDVEKFEIWKDVFMNARIVESKILDKNVAIMLSNYDLMNFYYRQILRCSSEEEVKDEIENYAKYVVGQIKHYPQNFREFEKVVKTFDFSVKPVEFGKDHRAMYNDMVEEDLRFGKDATFPIALQDGKVSFYHSYHQMISTYLTSPVVLRNIKWEYPTYDANVDVIDEYYKTDKFTRMFNHYKNVYTFGIGVFLDGFQFDTNLTLFGIYSFPFNVSYREYLKQEYCIVNTILEEANIIANRYSKQLLCYDALRFSVPHIYNTAFPGKFMFAQMKILEKIEDQKEARKNMNMTTAFGVTEWGSYIYNILKSQCLNKNIDFSDPSILRTWMDFYGERCEGANLYKKKKYNQLQKLVGRKGFQFIANSSNVSTGKEEILFEPKNPFFELRKQEDFPFEIPKDLKMEFGHAALLNFLFQLISHVLNKRNIKEMEKLDQRRKKLNQILPGQFAKIKIFSKFMKRKDMSQILSVCVGVFYIFDVISIPQNQKKLLFWSSEAILLTWRNFVIESNRQSALQKIGDAFDLLKELELLNNSPSTLGVLECIKNSVEIPPKKISCKFTEPWHKLPKAYVNDIRNGRYSEVSRKSNVLNNFCLKNSKFRKQKIKGHRNHREFVLNDMEFDMVKDSKVEIPSNIQEKSEDIQERGNKIFRLSREGSRYPISANQSFQYFDMDKRGYRFGMLRNIYLTESSSSNGKYSVYMVLNRIVTKEIYMFGCRLEEVEVIDDAEMCVEGSQYISGCVMFPENSKGKRVINSLYMS